MKYHSQLIKHDPDKGQFGDCFRTCIACLLDLEPSDVPHVCEDAPGGVAAMARMNEWLAGRGLAYFEFPMNGDIALDTLLKWAVTYFTTRYVLVGESSRGCGHVVVCKGDAIEHDTSGGGIVGPIDGFYWLGFIVKVV